jgi:hypothetical protein
VECFHIGPTDFSVWDYNKKKILLGAGNSDVRSEELKHTPWSRALTEKLIATQLVTKFPVIYGTHTMFAAACQWTQS